MRSPELVSSYRVPSHIRLQLLFVKLDRLILQRFLDWLSEFFKLLFCRLNPAPQINAASALSPLLLLNIMWIMSKLRYKFAKPSKIVEHTTSASYVKCQVSARWKRWVSHSPCKNFEEEDKLIKAEIEFVRYDDKEVATVRGNRKTPTSHPKSHRFEVVSWRVAKSPAQPPFFCFSQA